MTKPWQIHVFVVILYIGLTLLMTWPVALFLGTHVAGSGGDPWQTLWRFEEKESLLKESGFLSLLQGEFLGGGEARLVNLSVWPWMPLHLMFGEPVTYNLVWLLSFILAGYGMFLLAGGCLDEYKAAAFLAGLFYMFLPYHAAQALGHFGAMQIQWLPFIALLVFSFVKRPARWKGGALVLLVWLQSWVEHHYALWLALFLVIYVWFFRREVGAVFRERRSRWIAITTVVITGVLVAASWWPTVRLASENSEVLVLGLDQTVRFSADIFSFVTPAVWHPLWGGLSFWLLGHSFTGNTAEATHYLGLAPLLLIVFFRQSVPRRHALFWFAVIGLFTLIALGPRLHVLGRIVPIPLPYALFDSWPVFSAVRVVARASVMIGLAMAVLLAWIVRQQVRSKGGLVVLGSVLLLEFLFIPVPIQSARLSPVYEAVKTAPGGTLIEIPAATNYVLASRSLYASRRHGKEVLGNIALERGAAPGDEETVGARAWPALRQLLYVRVPHLEKERLEFFGQDMIETLTDVMKYLDATVILLHSDSLSAPQLAALRQFLEERAGVGPEVYEDALLYDMSGLTGGDGVFLVREDGWERARYEEESGEYVAEIADEARIKLINAQGSDLRTRLRFGVEGSLRVIVGDRVVKEMNSGEQSVELDVPVEGLEVRFAGTAILTNPTIKAL